jgi:hypothetical protein
MTLTEQLLRIDWQAPWWQPWRELAQQATAKVQAGLAVNTVLNQLGSAVPVSFVPQSSLPEGMAYEAFVFETSTVPTRDNLHDFFNGLAWLRFPLIKKRLNALQHAEIEQHGVPQLRGPLRDALTLFDENAAFLCADVHAPVIEALRKHDWHAAFITQRNLLAEHPPVLLGHALLEKLASPYKSITAHVFPVRHADFNALDACVAEQLGATRLLPKPFVPLPVLGVPLWWPANEMPDFYTDSTVFRPPRS